MDNKEKNNFESLTSLLKKGDERAFKIIFDAYHKQLFAFSLNYVQETYAAEEIVEIVFFKLWKKRGRLDEIENLKSYLYTMARNASLDYLKREKKYVPLDPEKHGSTTLMNQYIITEEAHSILYQALETLPDKCRKVFELSCIEGVKYKDIAEDLQISINTVKSQRARAVELLKKHLKNYPFYQLFLATF